MVEVEYLESTGTQYVDTGVTPKFNYGATCRVMRLDAGAGTDAFCIFGVLHGWGNASWLVLHNNRNLLYLVCGSNQARKGNLAPTLNVWQEYTLANGKLSIDGTQVLSVTAGSGSANGSAYLFCGHNTQNNALFGYTASRRMSMFAIYDDAGNTLRDFVPVRVESTGYLFDKVTGSLFGNSGTGEFIVGPDKIF